MKTVHKTNIKNRIETLEMLYDNQTGEYSFRFGAQGFESGNIGGTSFVLTEEVSKFLGFMILSETEIAKKYFNQLVEFCKECNAKLEELAA